SKSIQSIANWETLQDAFFPKFLFKERDGLPEMLSRQVQYNGEPTWSYINAYQDNVWIDPTSLAQPEEEQVMSCLSKAAWPKHSSCMNFLTASYWAGRDGYHQVPFRSQENTFYETHVLYVVSRLQRMRAPILQAFPSLWQTQYLGWPPIRLFHENNKNVIRYLYRYQTLVDIMPQINKYAVRNFIFSIAQESHAFAWLAALPREIVGSWENLCGAFIRRFHQYIEVAEHERMRGITPLPEEPLYDYVLRWVNLWLVCCKTPPTITQAARLKCRMHLLKTPSCDRCI
ncbi:hypothetical protein ACLOJK_024056, partial [Asimina triloba]